MTQIYYRCRATQSFWLPPSYTIYNTLFLISLLWAIHARDSEDAIFMAAAINVFSIIFDAITIGLYYGVSNSTGFATFMIITNLLLRPVTSLVLLRFYNDRSGRYSSNPLFGGLAAPFTSNTRAAYEDIDRCVRVCGGYYRVTLPFSQQASSECASSAQRAADVRSRLRVF